MHLVRDGDVRLLTLTGPGGVGKTRLALRVAGTLADAFPDGVRFVPLAGLRQSEHVLPTIATALGIQQARGQTLEQTVQHVLAGCRLLLVLDNLEHLPGAAPFIAGLLESCPQLVVLATSREPLHLRSEQELSIAPLALPDRTGLESERDLSAYPACALFLARARATPSTFRLDRGQAETVAEICRRVDGLPLAIELAAAQLRYTTPRQLLMLLRRRLNTLVRGPRDAPDRQRTIRACIDWSFDLLNPAEQAVLCRLAVYVGGVPDGTLEVALRNIELPDSGVEDTIHALVDKNLLVVEHPDGDQTRFTMLETIREYALERLVERRRADEAYRALGCYLRELTEASWQEKCRPEEAGLLRLLALERDNLRAILAWSLDHDLELGLSIAGAATRFWDTEGRYREMRGWLEMALATGREVSPPVRARAMIAAGWQALHEGDAVPAESWFDAALAVDQVGSDVLFFHGAAVGRGIALLTQNRASEAESIFRYVQERCLQAPAPHLLPPALYGLGLARQLQGDLAGARRNLAEAAERLRRQEDLFTLGAASRALGAVLLEQGDFGEALAWFQEGLRVARALSHREGIAGALQGVAAAVAAIGEIEGAARFWGAAQRVIDDLYGTHPSAGSTPLARLPQFAPHLSAMSAYFDVAEWQPSFKAGYAARLDEAIDAALLV